MFSEMKRVSTCTCPYRLTIYGLLIIGLLIQTIDSVTPGVFEQDSVTVWTDYAKLSPFLMISSILIHQKESNFRTDFYTFLAKYTGLTNSKSV